MNINQTLTVKPSITSRLVTIYVISGVFTVLMITLAVTLHWSLIFILLPFAIAISISLLHLKHGGVSLDSSGVQLNGMRQFSQRTFKATDLSRVVHIPVMTMSMGNASTAHGEAVVFINNNHSPAFFIWSYHYSSDSLKAVFEAVDPSQRISITQETRYEDLPDVVKGIVKT